MGYLRRGQSLEVSCSAPPETYQLNPSPEEGSVRWGDPWVEKLVPNLHPVSVPALLFYPSYASKTPKAASIHCSASPLFCSSLFFKSRKINVENTIEIFQANVEPLLEFVAETALGKQTTGKQLPPFVGFFPSFSHFFLISF